MSRLRKPYYPFTMVPNAMINDKRLSWKAKGIYALLFSKPDGWEYIEAPIIQQSCDGRDAFRAGVRELIGTGWLVKHQTQTDDGKFNNTEWHLTVDGLAVDGFSVDGKSDTTNTNVSNTNLSVGEPKKKARTNANPSRSLSQFLGDTTEAPTGWFNRDAATKLADPAFEWQQFRDHFLASDRPWKRWELVWDKWCRNAAKWQRGSTGNGTGNARHSGQQRDIVASATNKVLAELFGQSPQRLDGQTSGADATDTNPFGDGFETVETVCVDVSPNTPASSEGTTSLAGSHTDSFTGSAVPHKV